MSSRGPGKGSGPQEVGKTMDDMDNSDAGINPREAMFWAGIATDAAGTAADHRDEGARALAGECAAVATHRATVAMAVAQASIDVAQAGIAVSWAASASALYDDDDNNLTHSAHNMSYQLAVIARNTGASDDDDDEPSIAEATRIVAAANRYK